MILVPGFEGMPEPQPRVPWVTGTVVLVLVCLMAAAIAINVLSDLLWPIGKEIRIVAPQPAPTTPEVADFTLFRRQAFEGGIVDTGLKYRRSGDASPFEQFCYVRVKRAEGRFETHLTVAEREGNAPITYLTASEQEAAAMRMTADALTELARSHCRFVDGE